MEGLPQEPAVSSSSDVLVPKSSSLSYGNEFSTKYQLYQFHVKPHHVVEGHHRHKLYKCDVCDTLYRHAFSLKRHFLRDHINYKYLSKADITSCKIRSNVFTTMRRHDNNILSLNNTDDARRNIVTWPLYRLSTNNLNPSVETVAKERLVDPPSMVMNCQNMRFVEFSGLFCCHTCGQLFDMKEDLKNHIVDHPDIPQQQPYMCKMCDKVFTRRHSLVRHLAIHSGEKPFPCNLCDKKFATLSSQKRHENIHMGIKPYPCNQCKSVFTQSGDLRKHIRKYHSESYYPCSCCPKYFTSQGVLQDHISHHRKSAEPSFLCLNDSQHCKQTSAFPIDKKIPMQINSSQADFKYTCAVCRKRFTSYVIMCRHLRLAHRQFRGK